MKHIEKGEEPRSLLKYRKSGNADYNRLPKKEKEDLRQALLREQGYICCYCMQRIRENNSKIEHWKPQTPPFAHLRLDYQNLFIACKGNEGAKKKFQHCDTHKGKDEITINPADETKNCEQFVKYRKNGKIYSDDPIVNKELDGILNLNTQTLKNNRAEIMGQVINDLTTIKGKNAEWPLRSVRKMIRKYEGRQGRKNEKFIPLCQLVIYFLKKRFSNELKG